MFYFDLKTVFWGDNNCLLSKQYFSYRIMDFNVL